LSIKHRISLAILLPFSLSSLGRRREFVFLMLGPLQFSSPSILVISLSLQDMKKDVTDYLADASYLNLGLPDLPSFFRATPRSFQTRLGFFHD